MSTASAPSRARKSTRGTRNSSASRIFSPALVWISLAALGSLAAAWFFSRGFVLYYGDAEAHLDIARRVLDSRTPGYEQIGTVWLPLPHLLMMPFVGNDYLWRTGLAGTIPAVFCFALAGVALFATIRRLFDSTAAAVCATALFALNPNVLYLSSIPMTEPVLFASLFGLLYFVVRGSAVGAGLCSIAACLTRYEGWVLLPFIALLFLVRGGLRPALTFSLIAATAPLYWFGHNFYFHGNALEFYNGPYSPMAIQGGRPYPGSHDLAKAARYYYEAADLCAGSVLLWIGVAGIAAALWKRAWAVAGLLAVIPVFYVLNLYGGASPIYVPTLWPGTYYNTRYGMGALPLLILGAAALVAVAPERFRKPAAWMIVIAATIPWLAYPNPNNWIVWKESQVNSEARRAYAQEAAEYLREHYRPGDGILISAGDLFAIVRESGLQLRDTLHVGNGPHAHATLMRPDLFLWEEWAIAISADDVSSAMMKDMTTARRYKLVQTLHEKNGPVVEIYRRTHDHPIHESARSAE